MVVNWSIISAYIAPVIALFIGVVIDRIIERRPRLIAYFTHASAFTLPRSSPPIVIHTHGIVIRNVGKRPATDIRVRHNALQPGIFPPDFNVFPVIEHRLENFPGGGREIVFPVLVPNEQITISYLYFPPLLFNQIHAGIRHSEGFATEVSVLPTPQYPSWLRKSLWFLLVLGVIALIYLIAEGILSAFKIFQFLKTNNLL